jgi:hypothetical protein
VSRAKPSSRANGRLSKGPKTQQGKDRSKLNAIRHGLLARDALLANESREDYDEVVEQCSPRLPPGDADAKLIADLSAACWRLRRVQAYETRKMDQLIDQQTAGDATARNTAAFLSLVDDGTYALLLRYEARFHRAYHRSLQALPTEVRCPPNL